MTPGATRCRPGDLAVITREEPGCEANIGRVVEVRELADLGNPQAPVWVIRPAPGCPWSFLDLGGPVVCRALGPGDVIVHPDAWMTPIRPGAGEVGLERRAPAAC